MTVPDPSRSGPADRGLRRDPPGGGPAPDPAARWRVPLRVPVGKLVAAAVFVLLAAFAATEWWQLVVGVVAAAGLAGWAARDLIAPVRLAADPAGVTLVTGFARRRRLAWTQVDRVRVDVRRRSRMLEVDTGQTLHLFSRYDLDADLDEVAARLERLRAGSR